MSFYKFLKYACFWNEVLVFYLVRHLYNAKGPRISLSNLIPKLTHSDPKERKFEFDIFTVSSNTFPWTCDTKVCIQKKNQSAYTLPDTEMHILLIIQKQTEPAGNELMIHPPCDLTILLLQILGAWCPKDSLEPEMILSAKIGNGKLCENKA